MERFEGRNEMLWETSDEGDEDSNKNKEVLYNIVNK